MATPSLVIVEAVYPGMTQLDFTGPHTVFSRIPGAEVIVASEPGGPIGSDGGLIFAGNQASGRGRALRPAVRPGRHGRDGRDQRSRFHG